mmetsp:Transcript_6461/g.8529  ORF Transcript_6461/g.8529 Transcript_6461/m.8529 type:complete len:125 (+) Transcript_6461:257-631(+)
MLQLLVTSIQIYKSFIKEKYCNGTAGNHRGTFTSSSISPPLAFCSSSCKRLIILRYFNTCSDSAFFSALPNFTLRHLDAKFREHNDSVTLYSAGLILTNIMTFESPPSESCNRCVSFEFLYGTC